MQLNRSLRTSTALTLSLITAAALLAGCGDKKSGGATQVAAKVNKQEISVHQINFVLQRQPGLRPEQVAPATKRVLEGLIDQELAVQQASEEKLDRSPQVVMAIEAARREILARAYADRIAETASKPTPDDVKAYYAAKPALFAQRRIYTLTEFNVEATPEQAGQIAQRLPAAKSADDIQTLLKAAGVRSATRTITQGPENLPFTVVDRISGLSEGQNLSSPTPTGLNILALTSAKPAAMDAEQAKPAIEQFLLNERKGKLVEDALKSLRSKSELKYMGQFADAATPATAAASAQ
ncbi:MAG: EpsD family peptidyl-prolyl cis-trans isomerase [Leptothrix sp. (in: b-proteobacteria)]